MHSEALDRYDRNNNCLSSLAPIGAAKGKNSDDIPVAHRAKPNRASIQWGYKSLFLFSGFIIFFIFFIFRSSSFNSYFLKSTSVLKELQEEVKDGRLLGHFPYKERAFNEMIEVYPGLMLHKDAYSSLRAMRRAAEADGIQLIFLSGFRSHELQREIFFEVKSIRNQTASERARVSAPPGYSEHSTGYAIDLGDSNRRDTDFEVDFENTLAFKWLQQNAAKYHFVLSFPSENLQGVTYEPWHWRYEGSADALREFEPARRFMEKNKKKY